MKYKPQENVIRNCEISCTVETPLNVGTGIYMHQKTRCRELIDIMSDLNISIDYHRLLNIKSLLADTVLTEINDNNGVFIPRFISKDLPIYFAIDNTVYRKKKKLQKYYSTYLLTAKVNQKNSPDRFVVSSIAQNQSARTAIILFTLTTFQAKLLEFAVMMILFELS